MSRERIYGKKIKKEGRKSRKKNAEKRFRTAIETTYLEIDSNSPSIRCDGNPVENKNGDPLKKVTHPDFYIRDPKTEKCMFVEVTIGNGDTDHKLAQRRVVEAAGVKNYFVVTGDHIQQLEEASLPENVLDLVYGWFGWEQESR